MNRSCINLVGNTTFGQNVGTGCGVYKGKGTGNLLQFKTLVPTGSSMYLYETDNEIIFCAIGGTGGTGGTTYTFQNGLSQAANVVCLGGAMSQATTCLCFTTGQNLRFCAVGGLDHMFQFGAGGTYACYASGSDIGTRMCVESGGFFGGYESVNEYYGLCATNTYAKLFTDIGSACQFMCIRTTGVTISSSNSCIFIKNVSAATQTNVLYYDNTTGLLSYAEGGGGGFLGTVTCDTTEPATLLDNQWVKPAPASTGCFNYNFTNFCDSGGTAINVNLSLEDVYLRFCQTGGTSAGYWVKESYSKPISSGYTWIGSSGCTVCEIPVIDEWVSSEASVSYIGQKYAYPTHSIMMADVGTCYLFPHVIVKETINLDTVTCTCLFTIPTGKITMIRSAKLVMLCNASPTCFVVSIGNCAATSYNNMISNCEINDVSQYEVYELTSSQTDLSSKAASCSSGADVYFNVLTGSTLSNNLCAHLIVEGFVF